MSVPSCVMSTAEPALTSLPAVLTEAVNIHDVHEAEPSLPCQNASGTHVDCASASRPAQSSVSLLHWWLHLFLSLFLCGGGMLMGVFQRWVSWIPMLPQWFAVSRAPVRCCSEWFQSCMAGIMCQLFAWICVLRTPFCIWGGAQAIMGTRCLHHPKRFSAGVRRRCAPAWVLAQNAAGKSRRCPVVFRVRCGVG